MTTEKKLISKAVKGDRAAAEALLRTHQGKVYGYLVRLTSDKDLAAEALQETFLRAFRGLPTYDERNKFSSWLFRIAHNEGVRQLSRHTRRRESDPEDVFPNLADPSPSPGEILEKKEQQRMLKAAMSVLTPEERQVAHLRLREDMPFREIAEIMGCPLNTALGRMNSARKKLAKALKEGS